MKKVRSSEPESQYFVTRVVDRPTGVWFELVSLPNAASRVSEQTLLDIFGPSARVKRLKSAGEANWHQLRKAIDWKPGVGAGASRHPLREWHESEAVSRVLSIARLPAHGSPIDLHSAMDLMNGATTFFEIVGTSSPSPIVVAEYGLDLIILYAFLGVATAVNKKVTALAEHLLRLPAPRKRRSSKRRSIIY
jgi:hypothetical protein